METNELREIIWEDLFRAKVAKTIDEVAAATSCDATNVREAVNHEWFAVVGDRVSIAYAGRGADGHSR